MAEAGVAVPMFRKKGGGKRDVRARESGDVAAASTSTLAAPDEEEGSTVVLKKRKLGAGGSRNPLVQATGTGSSSKGGKDEWDELSDGDEEQRLDRYGEKGVSSVVRSKPEGDRTTLDNRADATRESDWYDGREGGVTEPGVGSKGGSNNDDGVYRGSSSYNTFITPRDSGAPATTKGPIKAGNNVRTISVVDYQPDVCKDYKETGYCGFGDTCKFMHDRSDYLAGWQLDLLPNSSSRTRAGEASEEEEEEEIPFACLICRKAFTDPIVTKCGHYFCSACAIKRFGKTSKCFACGKQTQGIFNSAGKVLERMEKAQRAREEAREERRWNRGEGEEQGKQQHSGELLTGVEIGGADDVEE